MIELDAAGKGDGKGDSNQRPDNGLFGFHGLNEV